MDQKTQPYWSINTNFCISDLQSTSDGLTKSEAKKRLSSLGSCSLNPQKRSGTFTLQIGQFKSPIILGFLSATVGLLLENNFVEAFIILPIVLLSGLPGFWQDHSATDPNEVKSELRKGISN